jgi:hypothetical protein
MSKIDKATLRRLAVESSTDPRTVQKVLRGEPVRGMAAHRIAAVLAAEGLAPPPASRPREPRP